MKRRVATIRTCWQTSILVLLLMVGAAACAPASPVPTATPQPSATFTPSPSPSSTPVPTSTPTPDPTSTASPTPVPPTPTEMPASESGGEAGISCQLTPVVAPTLPAEIPGYTELDSSTGLHVTGSYHPVDLESYRLTVSGMVDNPLVLSYDELRCMPRVEQECNLVCLGFFEDRASWAGASLPALLEQAGVQDDATNIRLRSGDGYRFSVPLELALSDENFLAYEWEGEPLPLLHGFPVRAVFPNLLGNHWVKWLVAIEVY